MDIELPPYDPTQLEEKLERIPIEFHERFKDLLDFIYARHELIKITFKLLDDARYSAQHFQQELENQFWRRTLCRNTFAAIEGIMFRMKQLALKAHVVHSVQLTLGEKALLREETYYIQKNGKVRSTPNHPSLTYNVRFAFRVLAKATNCSFSLDVAGQGWEHFVTAYKVRNRLTHPKLADDLEVSNTEMSSLMAASSWFFSQLNELNDLMTERSNQMFDEKLATVDYSPKQRD